MTQPDLKTAVLERVDFLTLVRGHTALKQSGSEWAGKCPFPGHADSSPSFNVNPGKGLCHCHGCQRGGNAIDFQCLVDGGDPKSGSDFRAALEKLAGVCGLDPAAFSRNPERAARERGEKDRLRLALEAAAIFFQEQLRSPGGAACQELIRARGLSAETVRDYGLGFAPASFDALKNQLLGAGFKIAELLAAGLLKQRDPGQPPDPSGRNCYDAFRGRLVFPLIDAQGRIVSFAGRALSDADTPKYLNGPATALFDKSKFLYNLGPALAFIRGTRDAAGTGGAGPDGPASTGRGELASAGASAGPRSASSARQPLILVEGQIDPLSLGQVGIRQAVACLGCGFGEGHRALLERAGERMLTLALDQDERGQEATARIIRESRGTPLRIHVAVWPPQIGKDPDELVRSQGGLSVLQAALENPLPAALWLSDYLCRRVRQSPENETQEPEENGKD